MYISIFICMHSSGRYFSPSTAARPPPSNGQPRRVRCCRYEYVWIYICICVCICKYLSMYIPISICSPP